MLKQFSLSTGGSLVDASGWSLYASLGGEERSHPNITADKPEPNPYLCFATTDRRARITEQEKDSIVVFDDVQAALFASKLEQLDESDSRRARIAVNYLGFGKLI